MNAMGINATMIVAIWIGGALLMVPLLGLTIRYAVTPLIGSLAALRSARSAAPPAEVVERLAAIEERLNTLEMETRATASGSSIPYG